MENRMRYDPSGSQWRRWDLHFHTPLSFDYGNKGLTAAQVVDRLLQAKIAVVAVTDHHKLDPTFIGAMKEAAVDRLTVLPGIELSSDLGGDEGVHFIGIFPENSDLAHLSSELMVKLNLNTKRKDGVAEEKLYVEFSAAARVIQDLGGLISIHGHGKAANYETITSKLKFKQEQKTNLLRDCVDIIEVGGADNAATYREKIFPQIGFPVPIVIGSDDHARSPYPADKCCWIKSDPTFAGLQMALREPESRFCLEASPASIDRLSSNRTRYIKSIAFSRKATMPVGEEWLQGEIPFNSVLVAIIGNKGSGKSAIADGLGLLGFCGTSASFSFLHRNRFCDPKTGRAQHVEAVLQWHDGAPRTRTLSENVAQDEPERVKYLPQSFVETVCNDLATPGGGEFERELKKVVFSKVSSAGRLGKRSLDELIQFRTEEIRREADSLAAGLATLALDRANFEDRLEPAVRSSLEKQIAQVTEQIKSHETAKPVEVKSPAEDATTASKSAVELQALDTLKKERDDVSKDIKVAEGDVAAQQLRAAQANKLLDKLKNLEAEIERRRAELEPDALALGLASASLVSITVNRAPVEQVREESLTKRDAAQSRLDEPLPGGLRARKKQLDERIKTAQDALNRPNQEFQTYLERKAAWQTVLDKLVGTADEPQSLRGLEADLGALDSIPVRLTELDSQLERVAANIHNLRANEAAVYTELYEPVQRFVAEHPLAKAQLKIEFKVELIEEGFAEYLLGHINQQRLGSFSGVEEGRTKASAICATVDWANWEQVRAFLRSVQDHLHTDRREGRGQPMSLKSQIGKGRTSAELYAWLYGLAYVKPRYVLKSEGKRLEQLSPGERGTLLLVFYLLVDDSDLPLIIDQPEANLDNATVAKKLVDCIRYAREKRQVVIVTHNPNLAVVCDADQIIHASMDISAGHKITYTTGALENPKINEFTIDVLEGGRPPFDKRDDTYKVAGQ